MKTAQTVSLSVTQEAVQAYAQLTDDFNPIHVDADFAAKTPMGRPIAHGTMSMCLIWQCLQRNFGAQALSRVELEVRFVKPVFIGDVVTAGVDMPSDDSHSVQVWVRGSDGADRIVGTAHFEPSPTGLDGAKD